MTKRLQVLLADEELAEFQRLARRRRMTTAEWVRASLRSAKEAEGGPDVGQKLTAIRSAAAHEFPSADIDIMVGEIGSGLQGDLPA